MLHIYDIIPTYYYSHSRDFQLVAKLYEVALNYCNSIAKSLDAKHLYDSDDGFILDLISTTIGFKKVHSYNNNQLKGLCSIFIECLRCKGTLLAVQKACNMLINIENNQQPVNVVKEKNNIIIYITDIIGSSALLEDILYYIIPAGMSYSIILSTLINKNMFTATAVENNVITTVQPTITKSLIMKYKVEDTVSANVEIGDTGPGRIDNITIKETSETDDCGILRDNEKDIYLNIYTQTTDDNEN